MGDVTSMVGNKYECDVWEVVFMLGRKVFDVNDRIPRSHLVHLGGFSWINPSPGAFSEREILIMTLICIYIYIYIYYIYIYV